MSNTVEIEGGNFSMIPNSLLNDLNISLAAKGLYAFMRGKPPTWNFTIKSMAKQLKEGETAIRSALSELRDSGWVIYIKRSNGTGIYKLLWDNPKPENPNEGNQTMAKPKLENPNVGNPMMGKPTRISKKDSLVINIDSKRDAREKTGLALTAESTVDDRGRTAIDLDWQPNQKILHAMCTKSGVDQGEITSDMITAFKLWYSGKQTHATRHGWHTNLVRWAIRERSMETKSQAKQSQQPNFHDDDGSWASDLGW